MTDPERIDRSDRSDRAGPADPVAARRAVVARLVSVGQRLGYSLMLAFLVLVVVGFATDFTGWVTTAAVVALIGGSVILAPAIVFAYAVKAAEREDREGDWR